MALFGFNVVLTMIVASIIHKLSPYYSFGRWFVIRGLTYYTVPPDTILITHVESESIKKSKPLPLINTAILKRSSQIIPLNPLPLNQAVILLTYSYTELKWLLDLLVAAIFVFLATFVIYLFQPVWYASQVNLSGAWCGFILIYALILLYTLTLIYLSKELHKERISQIVMTAILFVCCLTVLPMDKLWFDFGFRNGHKTFIDAVMITLSSPGNDSSFPLERSTLERYIPFWGYISVIVVIGTYIGSLLVFPSLNYSKLHYETLTKTKGLFFRTLLHVNYILPLLGLSLWFKPVAGKQDKLSKLPVQVASSFPFYRLLLIIGLSVLRFILFRTHMSTYLYRANTSLTTLRVLKNKPTVGEFKRKVKSIFTFYGGTCLQYIGPIIVLLSLQLLYVISSSYIGVFLDNEEAPNLFHLSVYKAPLSFLCWWVLFVMFFVSSFGSVVYTAMMEPN